MTTVQCVHCETDLEVSEDDVEAAEDLADGKFVCPDCEGRRPYPEDVPECDFQNCEMPAPFTISTKQGDIHRCREDLRRELNGETWNDWRFYRGEN
ncbi:hypothetical protein [Halobacterium hubeiense]|uniref:hypothetical protein n=1 Tax=Halobacterium hubeiense TaxID=1407499 RepID=UPI003C789D04